jgi:hypothetical protein
MSDYYYLKPADVLKEGDEFKERVVPNQTFWRSVPTEQLGHRKGDCYGWTQVRRKKVQHGHEN